MNIFFDANCLFREDRMEAYGYEKSRYGESEGCDVVNFTEVEQLTREACKGTDCLCEPATAIGLSVVSRVQKGV